MESASSINSVCISFATGLVVGGAALYFINKKLQIESDSNKAVNGYTSLDTHETDHKTQITAQQVSSSASMKNFEEDHILSEHLTRNIQFFGLEAQKQISGAFVVVVGLGGVGSHAAHLLLRSGVGRLRLVDFDQVTLSSLNRHCLATRADVGIPKATCLEQHFREILPEADLETMVAMYDESTEEQVLAGNPDFVFDAIDNIDTKVALLAACHKRGIPVLCSAGAGAKADPTRLKFVDIAESSVDPLARSVRQRLRKEHGIDTGIPVLLSNEKPRCGLIFAPEEDANAPSNNLLDFQVVPNFRIRTIPVLGTIPALFGMAAASYILCQLAKAPFYPEPMFRLQEKAIQTQFDRLEDRERDRFGNTDGVQIDKQEVEVILKELWRGMSARDSGPPPMDKALTRQLGDMALTRWNPKRPAIVDNLVLLRRSEADQHDRLVGEDPNGFEKLRENESEYFNKVEKVLSRARNEFMFRYY